MKKIVLTFGRFTPPQVGHAKVINKVVDLAKSTGADNRIYTSASFDSKKNPIPFNEKVYFLKQLFPAANINSDKSLTNLHQILKGLVKERYTDITLVIGEDREEEFNELLGKYIRSPKAKDYDPKKHYGFNSFQVVNAGHRDPNAGGLEGASGTKMREFVTKGDFDSFAKFTPTKNIALIRKIFQTVKRNMEINEETILEGCNDRAIFKAVFICGGPGSGKDFIVRSVLYGYGLVEINSDTAFEFLMRKNNMDLKMQDAVDIRRDLIRGAAKSMTKEKERLALMGRLGLIINGTGDDYAKVEYVKKNLEDMGYETRMLAVATDDDVSRERNVMRGKLGGREVPEVIRSEKWKLAAHNIGLYQKLFGSDFFIIDNSLDIMKALPEDKQAKEKELLALFKNFRSWSQKRPNNEYCNTWLSKGHLREFYAMGVEKFDVNEKFVQRFKGDNNGR